jgi:hypothetical protein
LVDAFRLTRERDRFVTQQMGKALSSEALQGGLDGHRRIESNRSRMQCLRQASGSEESIASLGLATGFDADGRSFEQPQCHVKEHCRVAALELELDLADRLDTAAISSADLALVDRGLNLRRRMRLDFDRRPRDRRREDRTQVLLSRRTSKSDPAESPALTACTNFRPCLRTRSVSCFRFSARSGVS